MSHTVLIAGVGPLLGAETARLLASEGCAVALVARSDDLIEDLAADLRAEGADAIAVTADVTDPDEVDATIETVHAELGTITAVVHNAAVRTGGPIDHCEPATFEDVWRVRAYAGFLLVQAALSDLLETDGTVLFSGSTFAYDGAAEMIDWSSAAFATRGLARGLASSLSPDGVHVSYVAIGGQIAGRDATRGETAVAVEDVAATFWDLIEQDSAIATDVRIDPRG